jgi:mRNA-degrading endonuclease RelE of RelBE toxin-antitoxin system
MRPDGSCRVQDYRIICELQEKPLVVLVVP